MISISVKTSLKDKLGTLCVIDENSTMDDVLLKIQEDLGLDTEVSDLVRLMSNGKEKHSIVRKAEFITDVDYYLAVLDTSDNEEEDEESTKNPAASAPKASSSLRSPVANRRRPQRITPRKATPAKKTQAVKASRQQKAVASVARATAAVRRNQAKVAEKPRKPRKKRSIGRKQSLSVEDRQALAGVKLDLKKFEQYLYDVEGITRQNVLVVVKQVSKLHEGHGIVYKHWRNGVAFKPGYVLRLSDDFDAMRLEAVAFEKKHGRDRGNGWLVRHPIRKMENYQKYLFDNLSKLPAPYNRHNVNAAPVEDSVPFANDLTADESESEMESEGDVYVEGGLIF